MGIQSSQDSIYYIKVFSNDTYQNIFNFTENDIDTVHDEIKFADFNEDGLLDIATGGAADQIIMSNSSNQQVLYNDMTSSGYNIQSIAIGDFNNDTCWDVAAGASGSMIGIYEGECNGSFTRVENLTTGQPGEEPSIMMQSMDSTDIDGDGSYEIYLFSHDNGISPTNMILYVWKYNSSNQEYYSSDNITITANSAGFDWALEIYDIDGDSETESGGGGGESFDITTATVAHNSTNLFSRIGLNGTLDFSDVTNFYRVYISNDSSTGNYSTPEQNALPFGYDYRLQINGTSCDVYNASDIDVANCVFDNSTYEIEVSVALSTLGISTGDVVKVAWETVSGTERLDLAPELDSFVEYTVAS
jgi:hypothetical protein